jgi:exopolysaccharide production protein ExoQ
MDVAQPMKISGKYLDYGFLGFALILSTGAGQSKFIDVSSTDALNQGSRLLQILWSCVYVIAIIRGVRNRHAIAAFFRRNRAIAVLVVLPLLSSLWSAAPSVSLRHAIALILTTLLAIDFASRHPVEQQLQMIEPIFIAIILIGVAAQLFAPGFFPVTNFGNYVSDADAWNGAFIHKNDFGRFIAVTMLIALVRDSRSRWGRILRLFWILTTFVLIVKAHSSTGLACMLLMCLCARWIFTLHWSLRTRKLALLAFIFVAGTVLILASQDAGLLTRLLGRDATLTGRTTLWWLSLASALRHPMLGYGYDAYWTATSEANQIRYSIGWDAPHAHNAFIEFLLELGLVGLIAFLAATIVNLRRAARFLRVSIGREGVWPLSYIVFTLIYGLTESSPLVPNSIYWIMFVAVAYSVCQVPELSADPYPIGADVLMVHAEADAVV